MKLRRATEDDAEALLAADRVCFPYDTPPDVSQGAWWLLEDAGALAAYCGAKVLPDDPGTVYLSRAGVLPEYRGQRLQRRLVRVRERWARTIGCERVITDTYHNPQSANTLIACGYRMWLPEYPWRASGACYWFKRLYGESED